MRRSGGLSVLGVMAVFLSPVMGGGPSLQVRLSTPNRVTPAAPLSKATSATPAAFRRNEIIVRFAPSFVARVRSKPAGAKDLAAELARRPEIDALRRAWGVRRMSPVLKTRARRRLSGRLGPADALHRDSFRVQFDGVRDVRQAVRDYRGHADVLNAQLNYVYSPDLAPNDALYLAQYSHGLTGAEAAWDVETGDPGVVIAVIGGGVELTHPDLAENVWRNPGEIPANGIDDDANGFIDDRWGWDFADDDADPSPSGQPHETQVAGVAGAVTDNTTGVAGVAWDCQIMALRIDYTSVDVANAILYARTNQASVINMSFGNYDPGKYGPDTLVDTMVDAAFAEGIVLVATAGNSGIDSERYPAALDPVIAVAATTPGDQRSFFSNWGSWVTLAAPGESLMTTHTGSSYAVVNGTSFAAPQVAGLAALLLSQNPQLSPASVRHRIEFSADWIDTDLFIGSGRLSVGNALALTSDPDLFALIRSPLDGSFVPGSAAVRGTALGQQYLLELRDPNSAAWTPVSSGASIIDGELGVLDVTTEGSTVYQLRLTASRGGQDDVHEISVLVTEALMQGWPRSAAGSGVGSPTVADVDGDGDLEVFVASDAGQVHGWHHDGSPLAGWPRSGLGPMPGAVSIGDLDGDADLEVVQSSDFAGGAVYAWHHDGTPLVGFPRAGAPPDGGIRGSIALADLDADGDLEMIFEGSSSAAGQPGRVHAWDHDGVERPGWPVEIEAPIETTAAIGDVDGDGDPEVVIRSWNRVYAFHHDGASVAGWPIPLIGSHVSPVLADLDADGADEVVAFGTGSILVLGGDGSLISSTVLTGGALLDASAGVGDVNGDGLLEICIGSLDGHVHVVAALAGGELAGWPVQVGAAANACSMVDVDGDGRQEILAASSDTFVYAWNADATPAAGWPRGLSAGISGTPAVADLDADGTLELIAGTDAGDVFGLRLPSPDRPAGAHWPMSQAGRGHAGRHAVDLVCGDLDLDAQLGAADVDLLRAALADPAGSTLSAAATTRCNVIQPESCDVLDLTLTRRALQSLLPGLAEACPAAGP